MNIFGSTNARKTLTKISPNFSLEEFERSGPMPLDCRPVYVELANEILEPVRTYFGTTILITSGYRSPESNDAAHGIKNSEHMATADYCAADFATFSIRDVFDWMRSNPFLPFHQLILEHGVKGSAVIHVSYNRMKKGVRSVLEGATHNSEPYIKVNYVAFTPRDEEGTAA